MESAVFALTKEESTLFPEPVTWKFGYGTAGFRDKASKLDRVLFRMGILAALRSKCTKAAIGVVITASHNPEEDNGVKIVDPLGEMLAREWEGFATDMANASTDELGGVIGNIVSTTGLDMSHTGLVVCARDTRPSGKRLLDQLKKGVKLSGAEIKDYDLLTTPQLHYMVRCLNTNGAYGDPTEEGYFKKLTTAYHNLVRRRAALPCVQVDAANGVGADKVRRLDECLGRNIIISAFNDGSSGNLNENCGADYVKTHQRPPVGYNVGEHGEVESASFDGDADRIIFFYCDYHWDGTFYLLDGDKIATLAADFISEQLSFLNLSDLTMGVVQTAYANGSSTEYLKKKNITVDCTLTGVKYLHSKAMEYDIGVYFEANGHGTVLFSDKAVKTFKEIAEEENISNSRTARQLLALSQLLNQTVGDAMSDLLMVEAILVLKGWGYKSWNEMYCDLPNRQLKVRVKDRMVVKTTDFERKCTGPAGLQDEIDALVSKTSKGRSFVRPSGTEDVVRVYAEAETKEAADSLAVEVARQVYRLAGGVGDVPSI